MPLTGTILQEEIKTVGHAQFRNGRQLEHIPLRVLEGRRKEHTERAHHHGIGRGRFILALGPVLELNKAHGVVLTRTSKGVAAHSKHVFDVLFLCLANDSLEAVHHNVRTLGRCGSRRLQHHQQHALVFARHEGARNLHKAQHHSADQDGVEHQQARNATDKHAHRCTHTACQCVKSLIELAEEPGRRLFVTRLNLLENGGAKSRNQRQSHHHRKRHGRDNRHGELAIDHARGSAEEGHRHEHGRQHHGDTDQSAGDLLHGFDRSCFRITSSLHHHTLDVFHHHNGVVHQQADGKHQGEHREHVD